MTSLFWESRARLDVKGRTFEIIGIALKNQQDTSATYSAHCRSSLCLSFVACCSLNIFEVTADYFADVFYHKCPTFLTWSVVVRDWNSTHAPGARRVYSLFACKTSRLIFFWQPSGGSKASSFDS